MKYQFDHFDCNIQFSDKSTKKSQYALTLCRLRCSNLFLQDPVRCHKILLQMWHPIDCRYALMSHRMMKLAKIASMFEDVFNLVIDDLTSLFRRAVDANYAA